MATQKELLDLANADLLETFKNSDLPPSSLGVGTAAITAGFIGKIEDIRFDVVAGTGITVRRDKQEINVPGANKSYVLAEAGDNPVSMFLLFEGGVRKLALPAMTQSPKSTITLKDGTTMKCQDMSGKQWFALVGKTLKCTYAGADDELTIPRVQRFAEPGAPLVDRPARYYEWTEQ